MPQPVLIIVESPNKAKKIEGMFPGRFKVVASYGHICDLPSNPKDGGIGINRDEMRGQYELTRDRNRNVDGQRTIAKIKQYLKDHSGTTVYLATDADREGESIAAFLAHYLSLRNPRRMRFNVITKDRIADAFDQAASIDDSAVASREARRLIDRIIGYTASPFLRQMIDVKGVAAGRVQTAVEALVIERERKIRAHKPQPYYTVHLDMGGWICEWQVPDTADKLNGPKTNGEYDIDDETPRCLDQAQAQAVARQSALVVDACVDTVEHRMPPSPLYTISMIKLANEVLGWDAEKVMQVAQRLFEGDGAGHGHITYHRTDSPNIDAQAANDIRTWLQERGLPVSETPNHWLSKNKQAQEGHEAIRPSYFEIKEAGADFDQRALYRLIRERAIYSQLAPARYGVKRIVLTDATGRHKFTAQTRTIIDQGWLGTELAKSPLMQDDEETRDIAANLPNLQKGTFAQVANAEIATHKTHAPPRYTLNSLTSKLERLCIGRPATMASLLRNIQTKGTIKVGVDKKLFATPLAEQCYDILYPRFIFANIGYTAELEQALDQIASGQLDGRDLATAVWDRLDQDCKAAFQISGDQH